MNSPDLSLLSKARTDVTKLPIYDAGISIDTLLANNNGQSFHNLSVNENPFGMSPHAQQALHQTLQNAALYPDSECLYLREKLAKTVNIAQDSIIVGNGSEDILELVCKAFINPNDNALIAKPTFSLYSIYANMMGANIIKIPIDDDLTFNAPAWLDKLKTLNTLKILMLANPSNPVGCILTHYELEQIIDACPNDTLLVIDEAYIEFATNEPQFPNTLNILQKQPRPWIVLRTFSKAYGLAGMRVGYGICSNKTFVEILNRVRTPYNVNRLAQAAAICALDDQKHLEKTVTFIKKEREKMREEIISWNIPVAPSASNFLFINTQRHSQKTFTALFEKNILVKAWKEPGYDTFIRISIGTEEQNQLVLKTLKATL